jgi:hypothetical protein
MTSNVLRLLIRCVKGIVAALEMQLKHQVEKECKGKKFEDINAKSD